MRSPLAWGNTSWRPARREPRGLQRVMREGIHFQPCSMCLSALQSEGLHAEVLWPKAAGRECGLFVIHYEARHAWADVLEVALFMKM